MKKEYIKNIIFLLFGLGVLLILCLPAYANPICSFTTQLINLSDNFNRETNTSLGEIITTQSWITNTSWGNLYGSSVINNSRLVYNGNSDLLVTVNASIPNSYRVQAWINLISIGSAVNFFDRYAHDNKGTIFVVGTDYKLNFGGGGAGISQNSYQNIPIIVSCNVTNIASRYCEIWYAINNTFSESITRNSIDDRENMGGIAFRSYGDETRVEIDNIMIWEQSDGICPADSAVLPSFGSLGYDLVDDLPQLINFTCSNNHHYLWFGLDSPPNTMIINNGALGNYTLDSNNILYNNINYYYIAGCGDDNSSIISFMHDTSAPKIIRNPNTNFLTDNSSIFYTDLLFFNFSFSDNYKLSNFEVNITNISGGVKQYYSKTVTAISEDYTNTTNISTWKNGTYYISIKATDNQSHYNISSYKIVKSQLINNYPSIYPPNSSILINDIFFYGNATEALNTTINLECAIYKNSSIFLDWKNFTGISGINYNYNITKPSQVMGGENLTASCRAWVYYDSNNSVYFTNYANSSVTNIISYGIDNCSNSLHSLTNATTLQINFSDSNNASTNIGFLATLIYGAYSYSTIKSSVNSMVYCLYPNSLNISTNIQILYNDSAVQYGYFLNTYLNNITQYLILYTQTGTSQVLFTVVDLNGQAKANYTLQILKYNVGTGQYTTTESLKTDSNGYTIGNIILNNVYYNFLVYDTAGTLVKSDNAVRVTTTTYTITLPAEQDIFYTDLSNSLGIQYSNVFNNATKNFVFTWADPSGQMHYACYRVINQTYLADMTMYDSCVLSTSGTIIYHIEPQNDTRYVGTPYLRYGYHFPLQSAEYKVPSSNMLFNIDSANGLFISFLLILVGILLALPNPILSIIYFMIAILVTFSIGLFRMSLSLLITTIILGFFMIYVGGKQQ